RSREFQSAFGPVIDTVPSFQTLGNDPAAAMARGPSAAEVALLPESQWLLNLDGLVSRELLRLNYPAYQVMLDFPLARWHSAETTSDEQAAVNALNEFLLSEAQQTKAMEYGLRPANSEPTMANALFAAGEAYGILYQPDYGQAV